MNLAQAWLIGFRFWIEIPLGALGLLLLADLTGGEWAEAIRPRLRALVRWLPLFALAFLPVFFLRHEIYPVPSERGHAHLYMTPLAFGARAVVYFVIWSVLSLYAGRNWKWAGPGMVLYCLSSSFAVIDWVMALDPEFYSTIVGMIAWAREGLAAFTVILAWNGWSPVTSKKKTRIDLGNLLLALVMTWAYLSFVQYLIVWTGNLPEETHWFRARNEGGWQWWIRIVGLVQFGLPFFLLLFRKLKSDPRKLAWVALAVIITRAMEICWTIAPSFSPGKMALSPGLALSFGLIGAIYFILVRREAGHAGS